MDQRAPTACAESRRALLGLVLIILLGVALFFLIVSPDAAVT